MFFDLFEESEILGKRLYTFLQDVYENKARYCVVLASRNYARRVWPKHEIQSAFNRAVREKSEYLLVVRLDRAKIDGLPSDLAYISASGRRVDEIATVVLGKVRPSLRKPGTLSLFGHWRFADAYDQIRSELDAESSSITLVARSAAGLIHAPVFLHALNAVSASSSKPILRVILPTPEAVVDIAANESRAIFEMQEELSETLAAIDTTAPNVQVRLVSVPPSYGGLWLSKVALYAPYFVTRGPLSAPVFVLRSDDETARLLAVLREDIQRLWDISRMA